MIEEKILELVKQANPDNPITFVQDIVKEYSINKMNDYIISCQECTSCTCNKKSIGVGNPNASVLILGESPEKEFMDSIDKIGKPFSYGSEKYLFDILNALNIDTDEIFYMNSVQCFLSTATGDKRLPSVNERERCKTFVDYAIETIKPILIIALGGVAINNLNEEIGKKKVTNIRGNMFFYKGIRVMPTFNPSIFKLWEIRDTYPKEYIEENMYNFYFDIEKAFNYVQDNYNINVFKNN